MPRHGDNYWLEQIATNASSSVSTGAAADNAPASGNPVRIGGKYNSSTQTYANGDVADLQTDVNGNLKVTLATKLDSVNDSVTTYAGGSYITTISTATTTTVFTAPGIVEEVRVVAGTMGNVTGYDNVAASGTVLIPTVLPIQGSILVGRPIIAAVGFTLVTAAATYVQVIWRPQ